VKLAWRNEVMHPNDTYTLEEAENLIRLVKVFMGQLATIVEKREREESLQKKTGLRGAGSLSLWVLPNPRIRQDHAPMHAKNPSRNRARLRPAPTYFDELMYRERLKIWPRELRKWLEYDEDYLRSLPRPKDRGIVSRVPSSPEE
jgi:hypothetical protein